MSSHAPVLEAYFSQRLAQRGASPHTIVAYRDTWRLLLAYARQATGIEPSALSLGDLDVAVIGGFLEHLETERRNAAGTTNARLAAIHSLYRYAAVRCPEHAGVIQRVLAIPTRRPAQRIVAFLNADEVEALLAAPDLTTFFGRRDRLLMLVAVQTGLRDLLRWRHSARRFIASDITEGTMALEELPTLVTSRHEKLKAQGRHIVTPDMDVDLVLVVIDELAFYLQGAGSDNMHFSESLLDVVARGRTVGVVVVAVTDNAISDGGPAELFDYFDYRLALRFGTREESDWMLGSGWPAPRSSSSDIDAATPGVGLLLAEDAVPGRLRCYFLRDEEIVAMVDRSALLRRYEPEE